MSLPLHSRCSPWTSSSGLALELVRSPPRAPPSPLTQTGVAHVHVSELEEHHSLLFGNWVTSTFATVNTAEVTLLPIRRRHQLPPLPTTSGTFTYTHAHTQTHTYTHARTYVYTRTHPALNARVFQYSVHMTSCGNLINLSNLLLDIKEL